MVVTYRKIEVKNVKFGKRVTVVLPSNLYGCTIGDDSFVGPFVEIQTGAIIGKRCRIQSHSFICELVNIGDDCFISHGVMFINDRFEDGKRAMGDRTLWRSTNVGNHVLFGTNATIMPVRIADGVVVGAGSVVVRDLLVKGIYAGNPAMLKRKIE
jgi:acetyltransferase-like isoleucine patch superfamily enzyme